MKKTNKVVLVVVLILVVAFGVGQFFAFSGPTAVNPAATSTVPTAPTTPMTQIISYSPPALSSSTPTEKGSCWTNSIAAPYRADAWRCEVGNSVQDPCFQIGGSTTTLLCGVNPAVPDSTSTFALKLTSPLPKPETIGTSTGPNTAWLIQLWDGTFCSPFEGTLPPVSDGGQTASYDCAPGSLGSETVVFGSLNSNGTSGIWTADVGELSTSTKIFPPVITSSSSVPVADVWE